jgi:dihydrofolate reductase
METNFSPRRCLHVRNQLWRFAMGTIIVSENVTVDGVTEDPTGDEGTPFGEWFERLAGQDREAWAKVEMDEAFRASAMLLGGRTYEWFAVRWADRPGDWADRLRELPKYVVSATLENRGWGNTTVISLDEVPALKERLDGEIVVYGSGRLVHALIERDVIDEYRLMVYPFVAGAGSRVFGEVRGARPLRLVDSRPVGDVLVSLTYQRAS